jgi:hypothetical protein
MNKQMLPNAEASPSPTFYTYSMKADPCSRLIFDPTARDIP